MTSSPSLFRQFILGDASFILSHTQFKRIILTGQLALVTFVVLTGYLLFDLYMGITYAWPYQLVGASLSAGSFVCNRYRFYTLSKVLLSLAVNFTLFVFACSEPPATGLYAFYIPICLGALAGFGYEERKWATAFILFSLTLCLISLLGNFQFIPEVNSEPSYIKLNQVINFLISAIASIMILYFLINVNHRAEAVMKETERQLIKKNEELTKLNTELDRFVYSSSHDMRAPLTSVMGLIQLSELSDNLDEVRTYTNLMKERVKDLDKFIRDISDYSRNTRLAVESEEVVIKKLVREVLESLRFYPGSNKIEVELLINEDQVMHTDITRLKMILSNLISNSFKYSDPAKEKPFVRIQAHANPTNTVITIADNGIGIPKENLTKVFEMFFQAHEKSNGSGLGLYIVKETVEKLGGQIRVESEVGKGSQFVVQLPKNNNNHA